MKMTVEIKPHGFELHDETGAVIMESEPANKGKLHRWLSDNGFKPSEIIADEWINQRTQYEAGREAAIKAAQNIAHACNIINIHPCDMGEVTRLCEEAKDLRIKAAKLGFITITP